MLFQKSYKLELITTSLIDAYSMNEVLNSWVEGIEIDFKLQTKYFTQLFHSLYHIQET